MTPHYIDLHPESFSDAMIYCGFQMKNNAENINGINTTKDLFSESTSHRPFATRAFCNFKHFELVEKKIIQNS